MSSSNQRFQTERDPLEEEEPPRPRLSPGKRTLTSGIPPMPSADAGQEQQPGVAAELDTALSQEGGQSLPSEAASSAQQAYGGNFSDVRVHTDGRANEMASSLGYRAFSYGSDVFFGAGGYRPDDADGRFVLMHELAHVAQTGGERAGGVQGKLAVGSSSESAEVNADRGAAAAMQGRSYAVQRSALKVRGFAATGPGITHENQTMTAAQEGDLFSERDAQMIYSGNWMRDMNQMLLPKVQAAGPQVYEILNILHTVHFGFPIGGSAEGVKDGSFRASAANVQEFGTYDPVEHIDNPGGQTAADVSNQNGSSPDSASNMGPAAGGHKAYGDTDPRYQAEYDRMLSAAGHAADTFEHNNDVNHPQDVAHQVNQSGVPVYINASGTQMKRRLASGARLAHQGRNADERRLNRDRALRYAGEALHIMQDYYAHSNFCEIAVNLLLNEGTRTLGDDHHRDQRPMSATELRQRLQRYNPQAGTHNLDTYVHERGGPNPDSANRDVNARTRSGREIMATGTFTLEDTAESIKEKAAAAINGIEPFSGGEGPSEGTMRVLTWLESNPEYLGDIRSYEKSIAQVVNAAMPAIEGTLDTIGAGMDLAGRADAAIERNVGGGARRAWHTVAGGVTSLFGGDSSAHDRAAASAYSDANAAASSAERDGRRAREAVRSLTDQLKAVTRDMAGGAAGLRTLYEIGYKAGSLVTLERIARHIPIVGPDLAPIVKRCVNDIKKKAQDALKAIWAAAKPHIIAEFNAAIAVAIGDTEVQRSDPKVGHTTSQNYTQPTHTDIAKDFDAHQQGTEDTTSVIEEVAEFFHSVSDPIQAVGEGLSHAYNDVRSGSKSPAEAITDFAHGITSAGHDRDQPHAHQHRHGGAWLASVAHSLAISASHEILQAYHASLDSDPASLQAKIDHQNAVVNSWYTHPASCRGKWEGLVVSFLRGDSTESKDLMRELARRTAVAPSVQAPNEEQYADDPNPHASGHQHDDDDAQGGQQPHAP